MKFRSVQFESPGIRLGGTQTTAVTSDQGWEVWDEKGPWIFARLRGEDDIHAIPRDRVTSAVIMKAGDAVKAA